MKILFVGSPDPAHSQAGGYHKITDMSDSDVISGDDVWFNFIPVGTRGRFLNTFCLEEKARLIMKHYDVVHFFYGDGLQFPFLRNRRTKLVATVHMNIEQRKKAPKRFLRTLQSLDAIISLSSWQQRELKEKYGLKSVYIPHGFDRPKFTYRDQGIDNSKINVVVSGSNYRDYEAMLAAFEYSSVHRPDIQFHLLGQPALIKKRLASVPNAKCYVRLNDEDYFSVIQSCDYNFLPLTFATANNTLLEAQFLGVRSIIPQITGIEDYAAATPLNIFYSSQDELKKIFKSLQKSSSCQDIITHADKFLWKNIYQQLDAFYASLIKK